MSLDNELTKWSADVIELQSSHNNVPPEIYGKEKAGGVTIISPKFGTSENQQSSRFVLAAATPTKILSSNGFRRRVSIRNVLNNPCLIDFVSTIGPTQYGAVLMGATGTEPTAGEANIWESMSDFWAYSVLGTVIVLDIETGN